jgi:uncharacterized protein (DUF433 family)
MDGFDRITQVPGLMGGKPTIRGMRVTVGMIFGEIRRGGTSIEELLDAFPYIEREDVVQALAFADAHPELYPVVVSDDD